MKKEKSEIIEIIQKLLRKGNDQAGTPEGKAFMRKAAAMMVKYRIEETEIDLETDAFSLDKFQFPFQGEDVPQWVTSIVTTLAYTFDCQIVMRKVFDYDAGDYNAREYDIIGTFSDVETSMYFIEVVSHHINKECWEAWPQKNYRSKREQVGNVAAGVIAQRAHELKKEMDYTIHEDEHCTALVIQKKDEIKEAIAEMFPNRTSTPYKKRNMPQDAKSIKAGLKAGESAPMNFAITEE